MKKTAIYLSILLLVLMGCKNDATIIQNMRPLEKYYKKYTVQQLVDKIMQDKKAKSVGIHFTLTKLENEESESGICAFRGTLIFNEESTNGYGTLIDRCNEAEEQNIAIKYSDNGTIFTSTTTSMYYFDKLTFLFESLDLDIKSYEVKKTERDSKRGEESLYLSVDTDFQRQTFQSNFPKITVNYEAEHIVIMKYTSYDLIVKFHDNTNSYHYHETLSWETEASDEPRLNFEKEAGQKNG